MARTPQASTGRGRAAASLLVLAFGVHLCGGCTKSKSVDAFPESFVGIGVELQMVNRLPSVIRTIPGGPAAEAGLQPGDIIDAIDGAPTLGQSLGDVVMRLRGESQTQVTLSTRRDQQKVVVVLRRRGLKHSETSGDYRPNQQTGNL